MKRTGHFGDSGENYWLLISNLGIFHFDGRDRTKRNTNNAKAASHVPT